MTPKTQDKFGSQKWKESYEKKLIDSGRASILQEVLEKIDIEIINGSHIFTSHKSRYRNISSCPVCKVLQKLKAMFTNNQVVSKEKAVTSAKEVVTPATNSFIYESADANSEQERSNAVSPASEKGCDAHAKQELPKRGSQRTQDS